MTIVAPQDGAAQRLHENEDVLFISKATPGDDAFALWLAPRLEAAGYRVFADILGLDAGDRWRPKVTTHFSIAPSRCCCVAAMRL